MPPLQKKYICGFCARAFTRSEHKQRHERSHTNEKPFHCLYCTSAFVRRDLLQRHCRTVHNIRLVSRSHYKEDRFGDQPAAAPGSSTLPQMATVPLDSDPRNPDDIKLAPLVGSAPSEPSAVPPVVPPAASRTSLDHEQDLSHIMASAKALLQLAPSKNGVLHPLPPTHLPPVVPNRQMDTGVAGASKNTGVDALRRLSSSHSPTSAEAQLMAKEEDGVASRSPATPGLDLVQLLSISKNLEKMYDAEDLKYPVNDLFLVGYSVLANKPFAVFLDVRKDLVDYLHSYSTNSPLSDFKVGLVYTILAVGALTVPGKGYLSEAVATAFINKAWNILVDRLIPKHTSLIYQSEILKNLYVLTYTYLRFFNNDLMLTYLEDSSHIILQNLAAANNTMAEEIVAMNMDLFWSIYVLVSKYKTNEAPPKFYSWFLAQKLFKDSDVTLKQFMANYLKSVHHLEDPFLNEIVVYTLSNEVGNLTFNRTLWIYDGNNSLHNAIILVNKSVNKSVLLDSTYTGIFDVFKKKLVVNAPLKFKDLLRHYVFPMSHPYQWGLLLTTLKEFNSGFDFDRFMKDNLQSLFQKFGNALLEFFSSSGGNGVENSIPTSEINNNLGIVSFPLIFNASLIQFNHVVPPIDVSDLSLVDIANLNKLVLEWYITVVKILITLASNKTPAEMESAISENYVLQCLMYVINDDDLAHASNSPEFYLLLFNELTKICDTWMNFFDKTSYLTNFRHNVNRFLNDLFVLALNNENFFMADLYVNNESILIRNRRSKSIGSIDLAMNVSKSPPSRGSISTAPPVFSQAPLPSLPKTKNNSSNYVLMNQADTSRSISQPPPIPALMSPTTSLPPLLTMLQFLPGGSNVNKPVMLMAPAMVSPSNSLILPPIHTQAREAEKSGANSF